MGLLFTDAVKPTRNWSCARHIEAHCMGEVEEVVRGLLTTCLQSGNPAVSMTHMLLNGSNWRNEPSTLDKCLMMEPGFVPDNGDVLRGLSVPDIFLWEYGLC
jgi:hypothetical protein